MQQRGNTALDSVFINGDPLTTILVTVKANVLDYFFNYSVEPSDKELPYE